jgi:hypothetical protein
MTNCNRAETFRVGGQGTGRTHHFPPPRLLVSILLGCVPAEHMRLTLGGTFNSNS